MQRQPFGERVNAWLQEPADAQFKQGKWRFWFPMVLGFTLLNSALTAWILNTQQESKLILVFIGVGTLLMWICVGALHYSDSADRELARGVSLLDSITLCCVVAHFCFLFWIAGHLLMLRGAEDRFKVEAEKYNQHAEVVSGDAVEVARSAAQIAREQTKQEKLRNDTAYQQRRAAQLGARIPGGQRPALTGQGVTLQTAPIELDKPDKPKESSVDFLGYWDKWVRLTNFLELILSVITLIFIRNRSAATNTCAPTPVRQVVQPAEQPIGQQDEFPKFLGASAKTPAPRAEFAAAPVSSIRRKTPDQKPKTHASSIFDPDGLKRLRETLREISFMLPGQSFKSDVRGDAVWIRLVAANKGTQETVASAKAKLGILNDAVTMSREAFKERLEHFLRENGFDI